MPITKYKLISVTADAFHGASWIDVRLYMAGAQPRPRQIYVSPRWGVYGHNGGWFKYDSIYITSVSSAAE